MRVRAIHLIGESDDSFDKWNSEASCLDLSLLNIINIPSKISSSRFNACSFDDRQYGSSTFISSTFKQCSIMGNNNLSFEGCTLICTTVKETTIYSTTSCELKGCTFIGCTFVDDIISCNTVNTKFINCTFRKINIIDSIKGADLIKCKFSDVTITEKGMTDFEIIDHISKRSDPTGILTSMDRVHT